MRFILPLAALALVACSGQTTGNTASPADVNAAAVEAQGDIDTYAANRLADRPPAAVAEPTPTTTPVAEPAEATAPAPDDGAAAAAVARRYFASIKARDYAQAYRLWADNGNASGLSQREFADSFAKYASFHAEVGRPGRIEAGAGQRDVQIPVRATGRLADTGEAFTLIGPVTLHRTVVDGASEEQRNWRVRDSALRPRPDLAAATGNPPPARCDDRRRVTSRDTSDGRVWGRGDGARLASADRDAADGMERAVRCIPAG